MSGADLPAVRLLPGHSKRLRGGHPWVFSNELVMDAPTKALPKGGLARIIDAGDEKLGIGMFNPHSLIAVRMLSRDASEIVGRDFIARRLRKALALRERLYPRPFYRLVHAEADGLPGLVVDRYGEVLAVQANTAGMELLLAAAIEALDALLAPAAILIKNGGPSRALEGLDTYEQVAKGTLDGPVEIEENGARFLADLALGQKTGWFFDQRENRAAVAHLAAGRSVLDLYSYGGGFAIGALRAGATSAMAVDSSQPALDLAARSAALNGVALECARAEVFAETARLALAGARFGVVTADPPAFVKSKRDLEAGTKGYRKLARLAAPLVEPEGFLFLASCSHHVPAERFAEEVRHGLAAAGRTGRILRVTGAAPDHPVHPSLPESAYLKALLMQLD
jgi:23S rRNA (cytosine1962-C5)-methyltransferase